MHVTRHKFIILLFFGMIGASVAQDYQLYSSRRLPVLYNPSAYGANNIRRFAAGVMRLSGGIPDAPATTYFMYDEGNLIGAWGANILALNDRAGVLAVNMLQININRSFGERFKLGVGLGQVWRGIDDDKLNLPNFENAEDPILYANTKYYPDLSLGLFYASNAFRFGFSVLHVNRPNVSFLDHGGGETLAPETNWFVALGSKMVRPYAAMRYYENVYRWDGGFDVYVPLTNYPAVQNLYGIHSDIAKLSCGLYASYENEINSFSAKIGFIYKQFEFAGYYTVPANAAKSIGVNDVEISLILYFDKVKDCAICPDESILY